MRPVWSESSLSAWRNLGSLATHWSHSKDSDQTGWMPRVMWVFTGRTLILLVLLCRGSVGGIVVTQTILRKVPQQIYQIVISSLTSMVKVYISWCFLMVLTHEFAAKSISLFFKKYVRMFFIFKMFRTKMAEVYCFIITGWMKNATAKRKKERKENETDLLA